MNDVCDAVCDVTGVMPEVLVGRSRKLDVVMARELFVHYSLNMCQLSTPRVGRYINRDHATVMHSRDQYHCDMKVNPDFKDMDRRVRTKLESTLNLYGKEEKDFCLDTLHGSREGVPCAVHTGT